MMSPSSPSTTPSLQSRLLVWLQRSTDGLFGLVLVGVWLMAFVVIGLMVVSVWHGPLTYGHLIGLLDPLLFLLMLGELVHTLHLALQTHHLPLKPFIALLWLAVIRRLLVVITTATSWNLTTLGLLVAGLLILSAMLVLLPNQSAD
ncbi:phosphate-starvation-inducible PsiE family protein [Sulfobacillus thermosulfidooxidans]|uniref:phosphate-starvation-inducible PsiE family protein n=1 Tax=Sulfobacillus thermosulfidooxidans TaxID=28034 RepID=UPI0006B583CA|nr:phosphate-starvation-inducible PsiE family protein [Sulfobacillus thermosulfidooxidans]